MLVTLQFGITPEKMKVACEKSGVTEAAQANLLAVTQLTADIHIDDEGNITGGFIPDMKKEEVKPKAKQPITIETVLTAYRHTKDVEIAQLEAKVKELKALQAKREEWFDKQLTAQGIDQFKKKGVGTIFYTTVESITVADQPTYLEWVKEDIENRLCFLEVRASKDQVKTYLEDEKALPPGVNHTTFRRISVRKG